MERGEGSKGNEFYNLSINNIPVYAGRTDECCYPFLIGYLSTQQVHKILLKIVFRLAFKGP
jgi:hypothetical protein